MAWTNCKVPAKIYAHRSQDDNRIHPTQKPIALYKWLLSNYAKPGDKILDTHVGSASSLIACHQMGFEYWGFELDADYFKAATERLNKAKAQVSITELIEPPQIDQIKIV
jgi:site-specific DNA-methyltransferase (adenine-specific)